jgi:P-type Cu2+ transporter
MDEHQRHAEQHTGEVRAADHGQHAEPAAENAAGHGDHVEDGHAAHAGRGGYGGHGDHAAQFRDRFWISLVLAVPVVAFSEMFSDLLGYTAPTFPGSAWVSPVLGTVVFVYGGRPFLVGAASELRSRQPGMMLLVTMAISVAFVASWATSLDLGGFDLDFWWELALLIVIMLLGHWLEMRALGAASGALDALAALLPDGANKVTDAGVIEVPWRTYTQATWC